MELTPAPRVAPVQLTAVPETNEEIFTQLDPPSTDPKSLSLAPNAALRVPVIVCEGVFVKKSLSEVPLSTNISMDPTLAVGTTVST